MTRERCVILEKKKGNGADVNTARRHLSSWTKIENLAPGAFQKTAASPNRLTPYSAVKLRAYRTHTLKLV
jgi:hypothetical protein